MFETRSPFERLRALIADVPPGAEPIDLSVGSPQHAPPAFASKILCENASILRSYPAISGTSEYREAIHTWLDRRYALAGFLRENGEVLPTSGSREGLFFAAFAARDLLQKAQPALLFANPFYQTYPAAAHAIGAEPVPLAATAGVLPDFGAVPAETLDRAIGYFFGSPSNPAGDSATHDDWHTLFDLAERHDFFLFADECYSEIYREAAGPPVGALEAARGRPEALSRLMVFNSLSKRSNLAGLRAGFVAGGKGPMALMREFRNQAAPQMPVPVQSAAAAALGDEAHVVENRRLYDEKFALCDKLLDTRGQSIVPPAGFFLWLPCGACDVEATLALWRDGGVKSVPGSYLALTPPGQENPGRGYVRLALVADASSTREALARVQSVLGRGLCGERVAFEGAGAPR
ncbi:MAG: aminotransferase class I/II-fold pyridoxal phosphate-dependent enzyme [Pseudomonadota bacterium]